MQITSMRPTFSLDLPVDADVAISRLQEQLQTMSLGDVVVSVGRCAELYVDRKSRRLWSPHLSIQIFEAEQGAVLRGRFSPRPEIWTFLMMMYFMIVVAMFFGGMLGISQWMVKESAWGLWTVPVGATLIGILHATSLIGQSWSTDQMEELRDRLNVLLAAAFGSADDAESPEPQDD